jgi:hypothetical protein
VEIIPAINEVFETAISVGAYAAFLFESLLSPYKDLR